MTKKFDLNIKCKKCQAKGDLQNNPLGEFRIVCNWCGNVEKLNHREVPISSVDGKPMPKEAIEGLTKAIEDVKEGRYTIVTSENAPKEKQE